MATATQETIRDRIITLMTAIDPTIASGDKFRVSRDLAKADFRKLCESAPAGCLRRFQVRSPLGRGNPDVSNGDVAQHETSFTITIAYPNTHRYGADAGRDRDDAIDADLLKLDYNVGLYGRANFSGTNDCTPLGFDAEPQLDPGEAVSFLIVVARYRYTLDVSP